MNTRQTFLIELIYGLILILGGVMGYQKAGSLPSLVMGIASGAIMIFCWIEMLRKKQYPTFLALVLSTFLTLFFGYKAFQMQAMRTILMGLLSMFVTIILLIRITKTRE